MLCTVVHITCCISCNSSARPRCDRRIEDLIVREYLERDKDDMQKFRYLA